MNSTFRRKSASVSGKARFAGNLPWGGAGRLTCSALSSWTHAHERLSHRDLPRHRRRTDRIHPGILDRTSHSRYRIVGRRPERMGDVQCGDPARCHSGGGVSVLGHVLVCWDGRSAARAGRSHVRPQHSARLSAQRRYRLHALRKFRGHARQSRHRPLGADRWRYRHHRDRTARQTA